MRFSRSVAIAVVVASGCGGGASRVAARTTPHMWARNDFVARHDVMTFAVLPTMARRFQEYDGSAAPSLTCESCHGADALDVHYRMPHGLPPLAADAMTAPDAGNRRVRFMKEVVTPLMTNLLDTEPYDPTTGRGLSCFGCHPRE